MDSITFASFPPMVCFFITRQSTSIHILSSAFNQKSYGASTLMWSFLYFSFRILTLTNLFLGDRVYHRLINRALPTWATGSMPSSETS